MYRMGTLRGKKKKTQSQFIFFGVPTDTTAEFIIINKCVCGITDMLCEEQECVAI